MINEKNNCYDPELYLEENKEKLNKELKDREAKASEILNDEKKVNILLEKAIYIVRKLEKLPFIGDMAEDIETLIYLVRDYLDGEYRELPYTTIVSIVAGLIYLVSPIDLIPDAIPVIGMIDDMAIIKFVLAAVRIDLKKYREWRAKNDM